MGLYIRLNNKFVYKKGKRFYLTNIKKVGFSGTLDPFASGLIIMGIGRQYTKQLDHFHNYPKHYRTTLVLGMETDTLDAYGTVTKTSQNDLPAPAGEGGEQQQRRRHRRGVGPPHRSAPPRSRSHRAMGGEAAAGLWACCSRCCSCWRCFCCCCTNIINSFCC